MKIISWNVNGIRALHRKKALHDFIDIEDPDIFFIQEIKANENQVTHVINDFAEYNQFYHSAEKKGYSGTSIWIKKSFGNPEFSSGMNNFDDTEGRIARADINEMVYLSIYFPNGGKSPEAWQGKLEFYDLFLEYINQLRADGKIVLWGGDVNCAHNEIDLARPKENQKSIGFLPEERAWVTKVIENKWLDIFRTLFPDEVVYSWWSMVTRARERNIGWRLDYFFASEEFLSRVNKIEYLSDQMGSDHCPILIDIDG